LLTILKDIKFKERRVVNGKEKEKEEEINFQDFAKSAHLNGLNGK